MKETSQISILFFGTSEFAVPSLNALAEHTFGVIGVVTTPDEPAGRGQELAPPPIKVVADALGIPVFQPVDLRDEQLQKELPDGDLYVVAAYGKIIPSDMLEKPRLGALNIHPSLLPRWRGPSPIQSVLLHGDTETGVSIIKLDQLMDHGPIVAQRRLEIPISKSSISKTTYAELHYTLVNLSAELLIDTLPIWINQEITPMPQDDTKATYSKILKKDDGRIDWKNPAEEIERMVRAFTPWPGAWTMWPSRDKIYRIRIEEAEVTPDEPPRGSSGYVWNSDSTSLLVKTGKGSLVIKRLTLEGKKPLDAASFVRGYPQIFGSSLV